MIDVSECVVAGSIPEGAVWAVSGSPGYVALVAMMAAKDAELVADQYLPDGRRLVMARAGRPEERNPRIMEVRTATRSFEMAEKAYSDWRIAWWREAIQNSVDAKARNIHLKAVEQDGHMVVSCDDDGIGMSMDIIENKFLVVGEIGEEGKGTGLKVGGFGVAKKLLCFKWPKWTVYSRTNLVVGSNGRAEGTEDQEERRGTYLEAWMPLQNGEYTRIDQAKEYLSRCHFRGINFTLNGKPWIGEWLPNGRKREEMLRGEKVDANAYYTKESKRLQAQCYVRLENGMYMFSRDVSGLKMNGYIIIELVPKTDPKTNLPYSSIEYLDEGRKALSDYDLENEITKFLGKVRDEQEEALGLTRQFEPLVFYGETGKFRAKIEQKQADLLYNMEVEISGDESGLTKGSSERVTQAMEGADGITAELLAALLRARYTGQVHVETALKQIAGAYWRRDFILYRDDNDENLKRFVHPKRFDPNHHSPTLHKLARTWADICLYVMVALNCDRSFGVGWGFSTRAGAMYVRHNGENWLLLNPYLTHTKALKEIGKTFNEDDLDANPLLSPFDEQHLQYIFSLAVHEATHFVDGIYGHGPDFAGAFTYNMALCAEGFKELMTIARGSRKTVKKERSLKPEAPAQQAAAPLREAQKPFVSDLDQFETGLWKDFIPCRSETVHEESIPYPILESPIFKNSVLEHLSMGRTVFAMSQGNQDLHILIPKGQRMLACDYCTGEVNKFDLIKKIGPECPLLAAAAVSSFHLDSPFEAYFNLHYKSSGLEEIVRLEHMGFIEADYAIKHMCERLREEFDQCVRTHSAETPNKTDAYLHYRLSRRFENDLWPVKEGFECVYGSLITRMIAERADGQKLLDEEKHLKVQMSMSDVPERVYGPLWGCGFYIPDMSSQKSATELQMLGHPIFYIPEGSQGGAMVMLGPGQFSDTFYHNNYVTAFAAKAESFQHLVLIAQNRLRKALNYELKIARLVAAGRESPFSPQRVWDATMASVYQELEKVQTVPGYWEGFGMTAKDVEDFIRSQIDAASVWMRDNWLKG